MTVWWLLDRGCWLEGAPRVVGGEFQLFEVAFWFFNARGKICI